MNRANPATPPPCLAPVASAHHDTMAYAAFITRLDTVHTPLHPLTWLIVPSVISYERQPSGKRRKTKGWSVFLRDGTEICLLQPLLLTITFSSLLFLYFWFFFSFSFRFSERGERKIASLIIISNVYFYIGETRKKREGWILIACLIYSFKEIFSSFFFFF